MTDPGRRALRAGIGILSRDAALPRTLFHLTRRLPRAHLRALGTRAISLVSLSLLSALIYFVLKYFAIRPYELSPSSLFRPARSPSYLFPSTFSSYDLFHAAPFPSDHFLASAVSAFRQQ